MPTLNYNKIIIVIINIILNVGGELTKNNDPPITTAI